jgi:hypothetical protein
MAAIRATRRCAKTSPTRSCRAQSTPLVYAVKLAVRPCAVHSDHTRPCDLGGRRHTGEADDVDGVMRPRRTPRCVTTTPMTLSSPSCTCFPHLAQTQLLREGSRVSIRMSAMLTRGRPCPGCHRRDTALMSRARPRRSRCSAHERYNCIMPECSRRHASQAILPPPVDESLVARCCCVHAARRPSLFLLTASQQRAMSQTYTILITCLSGKPTTVVLAVPVSHHTGQITRKPPTRSG